jgi:hypothetical protein
MNSVFALLFVLTGIFALVGGLYTWGDGSIFEQNELVKVLIPWADVILTGPLSVVCGYGLFKKKYWSTLLSLVLSGIYIFGSVLVFISLIWNRDFSLYLMIPAFSGFGIGLSFILFKYRNINDLSE